MIWPAPLHKRGVRDARRVGQFLTALDQVPDLVVSSPAVRAAETARLAAEGGGWTSTVELTDELYDSPAWKVMRLARETAKGAESLLVVSHEPTCSETFSELIGQGSVRMATGALARFDIGLGRLGRPRAWRWPSRLDGDAEDSRSRLDLRSGGLGPKLGRRATEVVVKGARELAAAFETDPVRDRLD